MIKRLRAYLTLFCVYCKRRVRETRKSRKQKDLDEDLDLPAEKDPELGGTHVAPLCQGSPEERRKTILANAQDADEPADFAHMLEDWQLPELIVATRERTDRRLHKHTNLILPEAGGDLIAAIVVNLPLAQQLRTSWQLAYSMAVDGVSLRTLYRQVCEAGPCVLVVEDSDHCIFGAYCGEGLSPGNRCQGRTGTFLFRFDRNKGSWRTEIYQWAYNSRVTRIEEGETGYTEDNVADHEVLRKVDGLRTLDAAAAVFCDHTGIIVGLDGPGLFIDQDLLRGGSWGSQAFASPCLATEGKTEFVLRNLEIWNWHVEPQRS